MLDELPVCMKCNKPADGLVVDYIPTSQTYIYTIYCHGETERIASDSPVRYVFNPPASVGKS